MVKLFGLAIIITLPTFSLADSLIIGGTGGALQSMRVLGAAYEQHNPNIKVTVPKSLSRGGGIKAMLRGKLDIGLSGRPLKNEEKKAGAIARPYARTPFLLGISGENIKT